MSAFKQFTPKDIIVTQFNVNKTFSFNAGAMTASNVGIELYAGINSTASAFVSASAPSTGLVFFENTTGVYNCIKQLYYTNYISSSTGDLNATRSIVLGADEEGNRYVGRINGPRYENYLQTSLSQSRYFPTGSEDVISVVSIPSKLYGNFIQPTSFKLDYNLDTYTDDGEGNIIDRFGVIVGQIFYPHGLITFTTTSIATAFTNSAEAMDLVTVGFTSSFNIFETQYKCTIRENEFGYSLNPSILSGSLDDDYYDFATGSLFSPYVTSIGLYDDNQQLLMVAKLAQPIPIATTSDMTFIVGIDRI